MPSEVKDYYKFLVSATSGGRKLMKRICVLSVCCLSVMSKFLHYYYIILILVYLKVAMLVLGFEHIATF